MNLASGLKLNLDVRSHREFVICMSCHTAGRTKCRAAVVQLAHSVVLAMPTTVNVVNTRMVKDESLVNIANHVGPGRQATQQALSVLNGSDGGR